jgi:GNAT superfamily N-acetyltransferase
MNIRKAKADEAERLTEIAHAAKRYWNYPEHWLTLWKDALTITPDFILKNEVCAAVDRDKILGFYALVTKDEAMILEHLWVAPEYIGTGVGRKLFAHAVDKAISLNAKSIDIESDPNAEEFYKRIGAKRIGEITTQVEGTERKLPHLRVDLYDNAGQAM